MNRLFVGIICLNLAVGCTPEKEDDIDTMSPTPGGMKAGAPSPMGGMPEAGGVVGGEMAGERAKGGSMSGGQATGGIPSDPPCSRRTGRNAYRWLESGWRAARRHGGESVPRLG